MTRAEEIADAFEADGTGPDASRSEGCVAAEKTVVTATEPADASDELDTMATHDADSAGPEHAENGVRATRRPRLALHPHVATDAHPSSDAVDDDASERASDEASETDAPEAHIEDPADDIVERPRHESLPELARHAAGAWLKAAGWTAGTSLRVGNELRRIAADPNSAQEVIEEVTKEVREVARDFLGITELDNEVREMAPLLSTGLLKTGVSSPEALRAQGEQLLRDAADVGFDEGAHPAFARILTELSPDEARILRLLAIEGPQPMVDVRAHNLIGNGSQLIAQALNMLGPKAGIRKRDRVPVYLTNLVRLNLVVLSDDALESPVQYQVLEAQPDVLTVMRDTVRARIIRRSVFLTPLGQEFCDVCLPVHLPALPPPSDR